MIETKIYVGLNDSGTYEQKFETEKYISVLKNVCRAYHVAFSFSVIQGGYFHENGEYTGENTLAISLIDAPADVIPEIARDLCAFFHQESVLVTEGTVNAYYINEDLTTPY
ncbi:MAG: hypothetical protein IJS90_01780 [Clostridia bacterium]|nr:hypothetical protein [Clostridia bacterium]